MLYKLKLFLLRAIGITSTISKNATLVRVTYGKFVNVAKNAYVVGVLINDYSSVGRNSSLINCEIGKFCSISWNVTIGATSHPSNHLSTHAFPYIKQFGFTGKDKKIEEKTFLGHDVWVGANAIVMPGVRIGNGAIIGAGAVVTKDVPPYAICFGVPSKVIRFRFEKELIEKVESLEWWHWEQQKIAKHIALFKKPLENKDIFNLNG